MYEYTQNTYTNKTSMHNWGFSHKLVTVQTSQQLKTETEPWVDVEQEKKGLPPTSFRGEK